jgi:hypothetical protein
MFRKRGDDAQNFLDSPRRGSRREPVEFRVTVTVRDGWVVDIGEPMDLQADDGPSEMTDAKQNPPETHRVAVTVRGTRVVGIGSVVDLQAPSISEGIDIPD